MPLLPYQVAHADQLLSALVNNKAALDASDTGTGKTYVALEIARRLQTVPLVVGPKSARGGWEDASEAVKVPMQFINYEKLRGARKNVGTDKETTAETEWLVEQKWGKGSFLKWKNPVSLAIFDEVHRCAGATSLTSKALIDSRRSNALTLTLSATAAYDPRQMKALGYVLGLHGLSKKQPVNYMGWLLRNGCKPGLFGGFDFTRKSEEQAKIFQKLHAIIFPRCGSRMRRVDIPGFPESTVETKLLVCENDKASKWAAKLHTAPEGLAEAVKFRQELELLKIPFFVDMASDALQHSKVVIFVNFTETRLRLVAELARSCLVGQVYGGQADDDRKDTIRAFQNNSLDVLVCNIQAGGEALSAHDPTGQVERTALISPCDSGKQYKQVLGRVHRAGGAFSRQLICFFKGTYEEDVAKRMQKAGMNIDLLNDGDLVV
jgi:superfamily II DNA or RNA helicase